MTSCYFRPNKKGKEVLAAGKRLARRAPDYGTWWIRYRDAAGQPARERTKARMEAEAEQLAHQKAVRADQVAAGLEQPAPVPMTCEELFSRYLEAHKHLGSQTPMKSQVKLWFGPHFKRKPVAAVTPADCDELLAKARAANQAPASVRQHHIRGSSIFEYAIRLGACHVNPWSKVPRPHVEPNKPRFLTRDQVAALLDGAGPARLVLLTAVLSGMRKGELGALRWTDINWDLGPYGVIHVARSWSRATTKSGKSRMVPLHPLLRPELEAAFRASPRDDSGEPVESYVFPDPRRGGMRHEDGWATARLVRTVAAKAGVALPKGFTFHDLRKTFITHLIRDTGGSVSAAQKLAGHSNPAITVTYYQGEDVDFLVEAVGGLKLGPPSPAEHTASTRRLAAVPSVTKERSNVE